MIQSYCPRCTYRAALPELPAHATAILAAHCKNQAHHDGGLAPCDAPLMVVIDPSVTSQRQCQRCAATDSAYLVGAPHLGGPCGEPTVEDNCPLWYDYCLCTVEALAHNIRRAETAEAEVAALKAQLAERT